MSKARPKFKRPNLAPAALLRVRLESLWHNPATAQQPAEQLEAALLAATRGHKPDAVLSVVLAVYSSAPPAVQAALEPLLPGWLARQNYLGALTDLAASGHVPASLRPVALRWLKASGQDLQALVPSAESSFFAAYERDNGSQAAVIVLWYTNRSRSRATGMQFLIDYNPPWEGALKDSFMLTRQPPQEMVDRFVSVWDEDGQPMTQVEAGAAKRKVLTALAASRAAGIRLPRDFVPLRDAFFAHVMPLPDLPDTPAFTTDDFEHLRQVGQSAEGLSAFEQTFGGRVRLDDGTQVLIGPGSLDLDDFDDDFDDDVGDDVDAPGAEDDEPDPGPSGPRLIGY